MNTRHLIVEAYVHVLALAMLSMGAISFLGYLLLDQVDAHSVVLLPDGALMAMLMGGLLLAASRQAISALKLLASLLCALTLYSLLHNQLAGGAQVGQSLLSGFMRMRSPLALTILAATLALCLLLGPALAKRGALLLGLAIALLALAAHLVESLPAFDLIRLGFKYSANHVAHLFVFCLGLAIVLLALRPPTARSLLDRRTLAAGILGSLLACSSWYLLSLQGTRTINRESATLLAKIDSSLNQEIGKHQALLQRMGERWESLEQLPEHHFWQQEATSYLRDFPAFNLLALLDSELQPSLVESRDGAQRQWLEQLLQAPSQQVWLSQLLRNDQAQLGPSHEYAQASGRNALLAQPLQIAAQAPSLLVASLNIPALLHSVLGDELQGFVVEVYENDLLLYRSGAASTTLLTPVGERRSQLPDGQTWHLRSHIDNLYVLNGARHLSSLSLLLGLTLTFFLVLSQRLAWLSKTHAEQVQSTNQELQHSLALQLRTQALNQRIMQFTLDMLCSIDQRGCFREISPSCEKLFGYPPQELLGRPLLDLVLSEDRPNTQQGISASMQADTSQSLRNRCHHRDGRILHILWSVDWSAADKTLFAVAHDITTLVENEAYAESQREVLSLIANDSPLPDTLEVICLMLEAQQPGALCSVLLLDADSQRLSTGAAPSLPKAYSQAIDGVPIGPEAGSCGTAVFRRQLVISEDIASDPLWQHYRELALGHGLRACWSFPLTARDGRVLGTFGIYYRQPYVPDDEQIMHLATAAQLAAVAIARDADHRQLQDSQQRFASLFSCNPDPVFSCDLAGHILSLNSAAETLLGVSAGAFMGRHFSQLFDERLPHLNALFDKACTGLPQHHSLQLQTNRGARTLDMTLLPIKVDQQIVGVFAIGKDITMQRAAAEQLRQSNLLLSMAGRSARLGSWALELPSHHLTWSDEVGTLLEYPLGDVPPLEEGLKLYPLAVRPQISEALRACAEEGTAFDLELPVHTRSGRLLDARITAQPVYDEQGRIIRMIGAFQDISAHQQALREARRLAERLRTTLESISDAFYTVDSQWCFTYINPEAERQMGVKACDILGQSLWDAFPGAYDSDIGQRFRQAMSSAQSCHFESYYPPFGRWFELNAYPSEEGMAVYFQDISQRHQTQQELQATLQELERSNQELQEFAFVASHDLQEPLRKIQAFAERLGSRAEQLDSDSRDYLQRMTSAAARMQALINDLLNYSRLNTRAQPLQPLALDLVLDDVLQDMETVLEQSQARIERQPLPSLLGDASQLRQVLQNLLSNAVKFQPSGNLPVIRIYVEGQDSSGWTLCVADNGVGFDEKYLDRIFTPFQRLHGREAYAGTGIGLAIVKKILERHAAQISASSQPGQGSTFRIRFPSYHKAST